jgi:hypothetical protein
MLVLLFALGCAKSSAPLPGDSVSADGGVTLSPARPGAAPAREPGAIESRLFPAELIMENQIAIGLTPAQKDAIAREVERGQGEMSRLQWELQKEKEGLVLALDADHPDEAKVTDAADRVLQKESKVKAAHLTLLVRVKGQLSPLQQKKLREIREAERCPRP